MAQDTNDIRQRLCRLADRLAGRGIQIMEICGTHTTAIARSGLRSL
ncbi:MAG: hydrogenase formation protein HypD, partial [Phycisphaerae bacterium]